MIIVKVDSIMDSYKVTERSKTIKEMADTGVIVLSKGMELEFIEESQIKDTGYVADVRILETPEGMIPPGFK